MVAIVVEALSKTFRVRQRSQRGGLARFLHRSPATDVAAVRGVSFNIAAGERVAFIGPNGAGKSTTLKMLTGILQPTSGHATVANFIPWQQRRQLAHEIGIVFGQRSQLWFHLPVRDSFDLLSRIYGVDQTIYKQRLDSLAKTFEITDFLDRPVSTLSLGQRIRCEIAAALLHAPSILLLDEPTIGLDVTAKATLRDHLNALSRASGTTVLLTSHDTGDIEKICDRVIVIDHGAVLLDDPLDRLRQRFLGRRSVVIVTAEENPALKAAGTATTAVEPYRLTLSIDASQTSIERVVAAAFQQLTVHDLIIENPPLEDIVKAIYRGSSVNAGQYAKQ